MRISFFPLRITIINKLSFCFPVSTSQFIKQFPMKYHHHQDPHVVGSGTKIISDEMFKSNIELVRTSAALSRFAESDPFGFPKGRISFSRPRQTGDFNDASRDCIQFKLPCRNKLHLLIPSRVDFRRKNS